MDTSIIDQFMLDFEQSYDEVKDELVSEVLDCVGKFRNHIRTSNQAIGIFWQEWYHRIDILNDYADGFNLMMQIFWNEEFNVEHDCWCCKNKCEKFVTCNNNHSDVLCWDCTFDMIHHGGTIKCGLCRETIKLSKNSLSTANGACKLKKIFPNIYKQYFNKLDFATNGFSLNIHETYENIDSDYKIWYMFESFADMFMEEEYL